MILTRIDVINNVRCRLIKRGWLVIAEGLAVGRIFKYGGQFKWRRYSRRGIYSLAAIHSVQNFVGELNQAA
jgi:hypothetical protein